MDGDIRWRLEMKTTGRLGLSEVQRNHLLPQWGMLDLRFGDTAHP